MLPRRAGADGSAPELAVSRGHGHPGADNGARPEDNIGPGLPRAIGLPPLLAQPFERPGIDPGIDRSALLIVQDDGIDRKWCRTPVRCTHDILVPKGFALPRAGSLIHDDLVHGRPDRWLRRLQMKRHRRGRILGRELVAAGDASAQSKRGCAKSGGVGMRMQRGAAQQNAHGRMGINGAEST